MTFPQPQQQIAPQSPPPGWYPNEWNQQQWWDGYAWGPLAPQQQAPVHPYAPQQVQVQHNRMANNMPVSYVRKQQGHSIVAHLLLGFFCLWFNVIYITISPNHYWHS